MLDKNDPDRYDYVKGKEQNGLRKYRCHKVVSAGQISRMTKNHLVIGDNELFEMSDEFKARCKPEPGGYLVVYEDGYESYSPQKAFEEGYSLLEGETK